MKASELAFLVVEDHDLQRRHLLRLLDNLGSTAKVGAPDGYSALELFLADDAQVDVIITDLDMPGMDGIEFIRHIGASGKRVAVVLASAIDPAVLASVESVAAAYGVRLLGVVEKPVSAGKLEAVLETYDGSGYAMSSIMPNMGYTMLEVERGLDQQEFEAFFQPTVDFATGRIDGFEALARWRHPQDGVVAPVEFIETMEQHGLIGQLTQVMLLKAASACQMLRSGGMDCRMSVNVSIHSLKDVTFADWAASVVVAAGLEPRHMVLEVTESAAMEDHAAAVLENLSRLRMKGFGLSIDDFGTGYSSMQQLNKIAFSELKIDRWFVRSSQRNAASNAILAASVELARKLRMVCVAEGVETAQQWVLLRDLGCDLAQGYFIGKPMEFDAIPAWAKAWQAQPVPG